MIEVKSGYGLDLETERKMLRAARRLEQERPIRVRTTFLGARMPCRRALMRRCTYLDHSLPYRRCESFAGEGLIDAVDGFCETIAFSPAAN